MMKAWVGSVVHSQPQLQKQQTFAPAIKSILLKLRLFAEKGPWLPFQHLKIRTGKGKLHSAAFK